MSDYVAKRSPALMNLQKELAKGHLDDIIEIKGHKFKISTLSEDEETWADTYMRTNSPASMFSSRRAPRLAAAIREMDGTLKKDLFSLPEDMPVAIQKRLNENPIEMSYWIRDQMLMFLLEEGNRPFITTLYDALTKLDEKRDEVIKEIPKS